MIGKVKVMPINTMKIKLALTTPQREIKLTDSGLAISVPTGMHNNRRPSCASSSANLSFTYGMNEAQVPNTRPQSAKMIPVALPAG